MVSEQPADENGAVPGTGGDERDAWGVGRQTTARDDAVGTAPSDGWFYHVTSPERAGSILEESFDPDAATVARRRFDDQRTEQRYRDLEARAMAADAFDRTRRQVFPAAPSRADCTALWPTRRALESHLALYDRELSTVRVRSRELFDAGPVLVGDFRLAAVARQAAEQTVDDPEGDHDLVGVTRQYWESAEVCHSLAAATRVAADHDWPEALVPGHVPRDLLSATAVTPQEEPSAARRSAATGSPAYNP